MCMALEKKSPEAKHWMENVGDLEQAASQPVLGTQEDGPSVWSLLSDMSLYRISD
jgi:hypothetical protein